MYEHSSCSSAGGEDRPRAWKRWLQIGAGVLIGGTAIIVSASYEREGPAEQPSTNGLTVSEGAVSLAPGAPQWQSVKLGTVSAARTHWTDPAPAEVKIDEARAAKLGTMVSGRVTRVFVELGQKVSKNEPLFSVASPEIAELRGQEEKTAVDLKSAQERYERVQAMVAARALAAKEETAARRQLKQAEVSHQLAVSKLASLSVSGETENQFTVKAPRDGIVVEKNLVAEQAVSPEAGHPLVVIADLDSVWAVAEVFETDSRYVREGSQVRVTSPAAPDLQLAGRVEVVSAVVDPERHTVPARVSLANPDRALKPNGYLRVSFAVAPQPGEVDIAASALVTNGEHQYVYVQERPGRFERREIVAGSAVGGRVPVFSGLAVDETILEEGGILLENQIALAG
jgi:membrane fusion protein, heavy metal efflux system